MPTTIVFDTNYIKGMSKATSLVSGQIPPLLQSQITKAFERGDLIAVVETVRHEVNAWIVTQQEKLKNELEGAASLLTKNGYALTPNRIGDVAKVDFATVLQAFNPNIPVLSPNLQDYSEAEVRTSYRLDPKPKDVDGEEMRDRVIWCQLLRYAKESKNSILIVSNDTIFKNGANSDEGRGAGIRNVESVDGLEQHLGQPSAQIVAIINKLFRFSELLKEHGVNLTKDNFDSVEGVRAVNGINGTTTYKFDVYSADWGAEPKSFTMTYFGDVPVVLAVDGMAPIWMPVDQNYSRQIDLGMNQATREHELSMMDLRRLLEG